MNAVPLDRADLVKYTKLAPLVCKQCGKTVMRPPCEIKRGAKFCGCACRDAALKDRFKGAGNPRWKERPPCRHCGQPVKSRRSGKRMFCSRQCFYLGGMTDWIRRDENGNRYCGRIDANQPEIVDAIRELGASVMVASNFGNGFPDLIVGVPLNTLLIEVKNPAGDYGRRGLNKLQKAFHASWPGPIYMARSVAEAMDIVKPWMERKALT